MTDQNQTTELPRCPICRVLTSRFNCHRHNCPGKSQSTRWNPNDIQSRPIGCWQYYRAGVIVPITEHDARHNFDGWSMLSCDRGAAGLMIKQLWNEIDQLRAEVKRLETASARR